MKKEKADVELSFSSVLFAKSLLLKIILCKTKKRLTKCANIRKKLAAEYIERGDATGWFDALYAEAEGDNEKIPWADLEPNKYLRALGGKS